MKHFIDGFVGERRRVLHQSQSERRYGNHLGPFFPKSLSDLIKDMVVDLKWCEHPEFSQFVVADEPISPHPSQELLLKGKVSRHPESLQAEKLESYIFCLGTLHLSLAISFILLLVLLEGLKRDLFPFIEQGHQLGPFTFVKSTWLQDNKHITKLLDTNHYAFLELKVLTRLYSSRL